MQFLTGSLLVCLEMFQTNLYGFDISYYFWRYFVQIWPRQRLLILTKWLRSKLKQSSFFTELKMCSTWAGGQVKVQVHAKAQGQMGAQTGKATRLNTLGKLLHRKSVLAVKGVSSLNKVHNNSRAPFLVQSALRHKFEQVGRRWKNVAGSWLLILGELQLLLNSTPPS